MEKEREGQQEDPPQVLLKEAIVMIRPDQQGSRGDESPTEQQNKLSGLNEGWMDSFTDGSTVQ